MSEEVERIGPVDMPEITMETPAESILSSPKVAFSDDIETLGTNLRNAEDNLAYLRMSEMRQDSLIRELQQNVDTIGLSIEKIRFYLTFSLGLVGALTIVTLISLFHIVGWI